MESITQPPRRQRAVRAPEPAAFLAEQVEMQRLAFGALAHELGNVTSPVALIAQVLERDPAPAQLRSAASTLARIADALQVLTALSRALRGSQDQSLLRMTKVSLPAWWPAFAPFVTEMIPQTCQLSVDILAAVASPQRLDAITTALPPLARAMICMSPSATALSISLTATGPEADSTLTRVVITLHTNSEPVRDMGAQRWMGLARAEARRAHGTITTRRRRRLLQCVLSFENAMAPRSAGINVAVTR